MLGCIREMRRAKLEQQLQAVHEELRGVGLAKQAAIQALQAQLDQTVASWEADVEQLSDKLQSAGATEPMEGATGASSNSAEYRALVVKLQQETEAKAALDEEVSELCASGAEFEQQVQHINGSVAEGCSRWRSYSSSW